MRPVLMEAATPTIKEVKYNRWLPYLAVLQSDIRQIQRSWVYRTWVLGSILAATGYLLYHAGVHIEARMVQPASKVMSQLLQWTIFGSTALIIVLTASSISSERGTIADSVLSRGISRYQYFFAKWHARLIMVIGTFLVLATAALIGSYFFLQEDLSLGGCVAALATVVVLLWAVTSLGVTFSAMSNSTVMSITVLWILLYGIGFVLTLLPADFPSPYRMLSNLPFILRGQYSLDDLQRLAFWSVGLGIVSATVGLGYFSRRDV